MLPNHSLSCTALLALLATTLTAAPVFQDGFEAGTLTAPWTTGVTNAGRVSIETQFVPATGQRHLVLDDQTNDAVASVAEAILSLNLDKKRNAILTFKAKSLGNEPDVPPAGNLGGTRTFDGVSISVDGGTTWHLVQSLANIATTWTTLSIGLDSLVGGASQWGADVRIRFSGYDNSPAPIDGIAIDDVLVEADEDVRASFELPGSSFVEGSQGHTAFVVLSAPPTAPLTLLLEASVTGAVALPASVTVPAGETAVSFTFSIVDDAFFNLSRPVSLWINAAGVAGTPAAIIILDDEAPKARLSLPTQVAEGEGSSVNATIAIDVVPSVPVRFTVSATPLGHVSHPTSVTIQAGQTEARFAVRALDDTRIEGPTTVSLQATAEGVEPASGTVAVVDNEPRTLELSGSGSQYEGETSSATVKLAGTVTADLAIGLESVPPGLIELAVPAMVRAGQSQVTIQLRAGQNTTPQPTRSVQLYVTAAGFSSNPVGWVLYDDDVAWYQFEMLPDALEAGKERRFTVRAMDVDGNQVSRFAGSVMLEAELPDGSAIPLRPEPVVFSNGEWREPVTVPQVSVSPVRFRATDALGNRGVSNYFEVFRLLNLKIVDQVWDASRGRLYASVSAADAGPHANGVVAIDPQSLDIVASVKTDNSPSRLALSSGGERLYAALDSTGRIAAIDPAAFTVLSIFPVGISPRYGALFAGDMVVVAGQPGLLVALRHQRGASPGPNSVAVYRDGELLPMVTTEDEPGCQAIEPSPDPSLLFAYNWNNPSAMRTLRISAGGVAWQDTFLDPGLGYALDFRSVGTTTILGSGQLIDGPTGRLLGQFSDSGFGGHVVPDPSRDLVFMLHRGGASFDHYQYLSAYDTRSLVRQRGLFFQSPFYLAGSLLRWGSHGLAWRSSDAVVLMSSLALVPESATADLGVRIDMAPYPTTPTAPHGHVIRITNHGPDTARAVVVDAELYGNTDLQNIVASQGVADRRGSVVTAALGDLESGRTATLQLTVQPTRSPSTICKATVKSHAFDPDYGNNFAYRLTVGEISLIPNAATPALEVAGRSLVYDPKRRRLWTTLWFSAPDPDEGALVSVDPLTGRVSEAVSFVGTPMGGVMALSGNGRYLYIGLSQRSEVMRFDLEVDPPTHTRIPISKPDGSSQNAADIEVLDGDGTSFLVSATEGGPPRVYDGLVPRAKAATEELVLRFKRTGTPGVFAGVNSSYDPFDLTRLTVTGEGVTASHRIANAGVLGSDVAASGSWALTSAGRLYDMTVPSFKRDFGLYGQPCLDDANGRAFLVSGGGIHGFEATTGNSLGTLPIQSFSTNLWADECVRWGLDGFAVVGADRLFLARWDQAIADGADTNGNAVPDRWEAAHLGPFGGDLAADPDNDSLPSGLEYIFGTPAGKSTADPRQVSVTEQGLVRLVFPRRVGIDPGWYAYEAAARLDAWIPVTPVSETVLSTQTVDGVAMETVEALIQLPAGENGFVRMVSPRR